MVVFPAIRFLRIAPRALETWINGPTRWKHRGIALNTKRAVPGILCCCDEAKTMLPSHVGVSVNFGTPRSSIL